MGHLQWGRLRSTVKNRQHSRSVQAQPWVSPPLGARCLRVGFTSWCSYPASIEIKCPHYRRLLPNKKCPPPPIARWLRGKMVGETGFEPATSCSQSRRATRLRYSPNEDLLAPVGRKGKRTDSTRHQTAGRNPNCNYVWLVAISIFPRCPTGDNYEKSTTLHLDGVRLR